MSFFDGLLKTSSPKPADGDKNVADIKVNKLTANDLSAKYDLQPVKSSGEDRSPATTTLSPHTDTGDKNFIARLRVEEEAYNEAGRSKTVAAIETALDNNEDVKTLRARILKQRARLEGLDENDEDDRSMVATAKSIISEIEVGIEAIRKSTSAKLAGENGVDEGADVLGPNIEVIQDQTIDGIKIPGWVGTLKQFPNFVFIPGDKMYDGDSNKIYAFALTKDLGRPTNGFDNVTVFDRVEGTNLPELSEEGTLRTYNKPLNAYETKDAKILRQMRTVLGVTTDEDITTFIKAASKRQ